MKREIKFRVWIKSRKTLLERVIGFVIDPNKKRFRYYRLDETQEDGIGTQVFDLSDIKLMQFTGLKDKNGAGVYEGDIIKFGDGVKGVVEFFQGCYIIKIGSDMNMEILLYRFRFEVIGSVHENPNLLK